MVICYFFREASWYSRYANCVLTLIFFFISAINIIPNDCCDCSTKKKEEPNKYRLIGNGNGKNSIPNKEKETEEDEIDDNNTVKDRIPEDINSHNTSNHSELLNKVDAITNNDNIQNISNEISTDEKLTDEKPINEKPIDKKSIEEILHNKGQIEEKPADKKKEFISEITKNISENNWDEYDKSIKKYAKYTINENIKNNPYTKILSCYSIKETNFQYVINKHKEVEEKYKKFTSENIIKNGKTKTDIFEYALECDINMSEAINGSDYNKILASKGRNMEINEEANSDKKINIDGCQIIAINNPKFINGLKGKHGGTYIRNDYNNIMYNIKECLYAKLENNKLTRLNITYIKNILNECFPNSSVKSNAKNGTIKLQMGERNEILKEYYGICKFHNLMYNVLLNSNATSKIPADISISAVYKGISDALNSTYATIVNVLNKHSSNQKY